MDTLNFSQIADRKGGGSTLTVSLTVKYSFFFDDFPYCVNKF